MSHTPEPWVDQKYIDRFWSRVQVRGNDDCWEWTRGKTADGYGVFHFGQSSVRAHRFAYQSINGKIDEHSCVCHSCDNPKCVNPAHLWLGTRAENNADKEAKLRGTHPVQLHGEGNSNSALTTPEVMAIRVMARKGMPQARIAKYLGVSAAAVCMIVNNERRQDETERRVSACVNACAGIPIHDLETSNTLSEATRKLINETSADNATLRTTLTTQAEEAAKLMEQRDELLVSGKAVVERWDSTTWKCVPHTGEVIHRLRAAIAKAEAP